MTPPFLNLQLRMTAASACVLLALSGCGGGDSATPTDASVPAAMRTSRAHALAAPTNSDPAPTGVAASAITSTEAARRLLDFAERVFPNYFPGHQTTVSFPPYLYRYYPESGNYVAVANGRVYVVGTSFGNDLVDVGLVSAFVDLTPGPSATVTTPSTGKAPWHITTNAKFELRDASGQLIAGTPSCVSQEPEALVVAADCSSMTGQRLVITPVTLSVGGQSGTATVKVIPQAQPLGAQGSGQTFSLAVTTDGRVLAWGNNSSGQLGQGKSYSVLTKLALPTAVLNEKGDGPLGGIVASSAGEATALALTEDGEVYAWGYNRGYALGNAATGDYATLPVKVQSPNGRSTLQHIVSVAVGDSNAIALADDGTVYTWGSYNGQAGDSAGRRAPGVIMPPPGLTTLPPAVAIAAGWNSNAALLNDGRVITWGFTSGLNLGRPIASSNNYLPGFVVQADATTPLTNIATLSVGYMHALALDADGKLWSWGNNSQGQLGTGGNANTYASAVKSADGKSLFTGINQIAAGGNHSLAIDNTGYVYSWGLATSGQLGDGVNRMAGNGRNLPAAVFSMSGVGGLGSVAAVAAGYENSSVVLKDGTVLSWGKGFNGNNGQGVATNLADSPVPLAVVSESGTGTLQLGPMSTWPNLTRRAR